MYAWRQLVRMLASAAVLAAAAAALTSCGSVTASGSDHSAPPLAATSTAPARASASPGRALTACTTSGLKVTLDSGAAGVAAGSSLVPIEFSNASASSCTLSGYPAVTFAASAGGPQIGTAAVAEQHVRSVTLTLSPGGVAHAWLQITDVASYPARTCRPVQAGGLQVTLRGTPTAAYLPHSFQACANRMPGSAVLAVYPVQAGGASRGTAP